MKSYLLDTDTCIYIIKKKPRQVLEKFLEITPQQIGVSTITVAELRFGVEKSSRPEKNQKALALFLAPLVMVDFDEKAAAHYGKIRNHLQSTGRMIGAMDLLIAAQGVSRELVVITNNTREFGRVPGLLIENWISH